MATGTTKFVIVVPVIVSHGHLENKPTIGGMGDGIAADVPASQSLQNSEKCKD